MHNSAALMPRGKKALETKLHFLDLTLPFYCPHDLNSIKEQKIN